MSILDDIIKSADKDLFEKNANDNNGAPDNAQNPNAQNGGDINALASSFIQEVEAFKQSLTQNVAQAGQQQQQTDQQVDPSLNQQQPGQQQVDSSTSATIQKPDGTIIKVGSIVKLATIHGAKLFREVR